MNTTKLWPVLVLMLSGNAFAAGAPNFSESSSLTFQYLPNSDYETVVGMGWYKFKPSSAGFYINGQVTAQTTSEREDFYESLSIGSFGDPVTGYISDFATINIGTTYSVTENLGLFVGVGYASVEGYAEKFDPLYILDIDGSYLVRDPSVDDSGFNGNGGLMLQLGRLSVELGYHSYVSQGYIGIGMSF